MIEPILFGAKVVFLLLLYFFIFRIVRSLTRDLRIGTEPISMPARPAEAAVPVNLDQLPLPGVQDTAVGLKVEPEIAAAPAAGAAGERGTRQPEARRQEADANEREFDYLYNQLKPRLVVQHSKVIDEDKVFEIKGGVTIGRSPGSQIVLSDEFVSSTHARIFARKQFFFIEDLGSTNGTFIDGRRLDGERQIKPGQEIVIGDTIFRYEE